MERGKGLPAPFNGGSADHGVIPAMEPGAYSGYRTDDFSDILQKLWRRKWVIVGVTVGALALAGIVVTQLTPRYSAQAKLRIGVPEARMTDIESVLSSQSADTAVMESEVHVLQSRDLADRVVERLALDRVPEFNWRLREPTLLDRLNPGRFLRSLFAPPDPPATDTAQPSPEIGDTSPSRRDRERESVISSLLSAVYIEPLGRSHIISIGVQSEDPELAARISNTLGRTYVEEKMAERLEATERADEWLSRHIAELRRKVEASERAVEDYRREHGLYTSRADTITSQQLSELNTQLVVAQAKNAEAQARLNQAQQQAKSPNAGDTMPEVLSSPLIQALKQQQSTVERRAAELSTRYGQKHPQMLNVQAELEDIRQKISAEIQKVIAGLRNEAQTAAARYEAIRSNLESIKQDMGQTNAESIKLRALEREAEANRGLLQQFLQRSKETDVQRDIRQADAKLISYAAVPGSPAFPPVNMILALALLCGAMGGVLLALLLEHLDNTFRTDDDIEQRTALPVLSVIPKIRRRQLMSEYLMKSPTSEYSEALRKLEMSVLPKEPDERAEVVLMASAVPDEGKSGICLSLARIAASANAKVVVVDCDWRRPQLHSILKQNNRAGLGDLLAGRAGPEDVVYRDASGAHMIFAGHLRTRDARLIYSERMNQLLQSLARHYDLVLIDTPPVLVGAEVLHLSRMVDQAIYVVRWGHTRRDVALKGLRHLAGGSAPVTGIVLSQVDTKRYRRHVERANYYGGRSSVTGMAA